MTISSLAAEHLPSKSTSLCWASIQGKVMSLVVNLLNYTIGHTAVCGLCTACKESIRMWLGATAMHLYSLSASEGKMGATAMHLYSLSASEIQQFVTNGLM